MKEQKPLFMNKTTKVTQQQNQLKVFMVFQDFLFTYAQYLLH